MEVCERCGYEELHYAECNHAVQHYSEYLYTEYHYIKCDGFMKAEKMFENR